MSNIISFNSSKASSRRKGKAGFHGSDLEKIEEIYGIPAKELAAFGSNVNPLGCSPLMKEGLAKEIDLVTSYPDRDYRALREAIAAYTQVPAECVAVGNGSTELISLAMQVTHPKRACIIGPTYSEYRREITLGGGESFFFLLEAGEAFALNLPRLFETLEESRADLLVLCNPNNPTSTALTIDEMAQVLMFCRERGILVVVDETYVEFALDSDTAQQMNAAPDSSDTAQQMNTAPDSLHAGIMLPPYSAAPLLYMFDNLLILRGTSKFFAVPGLRLGYALCNNPSLLEQIKTLQNPWSINSLAARAGELMFTDYNYIAQTKALIHKERRKIMTRLSKIPALKAYEPKANFVLVEILDDSKTAFDFFEYALNARLMIRDCSDFPGLDGNFFRFCFLNPEDNERLMTCLEEYFL